jgi:hypothetical protein
MYLNGYSVRIPEKHEDSSGYVTMKHNTQYKVVLKNSNRLRCNAKLEIDGKHQGTWRINAHDSIAIERPAHDDGKFTFYRANSEQGNRIGLMSTDPNLGLIKVTFTSEKEPRSWGGGQSADIVTFGIKGLEAGGTGLSGVSEQRFGVAEEMKLDLSKSVVIHLRLVSESTSDPRPLTNYSTPIPPPIG